jgi:hypothetical protein
LVADSRPDLFAVARNDFEPDKIAHGGLFNRRNWWSIYSIRAPPIKAQDVLLGSEQVRPALRWFPSGCYNIPRIVREAPNRQP